MTTPTVNTEFPSGQVCFLTHCRTTGHSASLPPVTGLRGVGNGLAGLTKFDYGPYGLGPMHPLPLAQAFNDAMTQSTNQMVAPVRTMGMGMMNPMMMGGI